jgi:hypothetical protein
MSYGYGPVEYASMDMRSARIPLYDFHCSPCAKGWRSHCKQGCTPDCDGVRDCGASRSSSRMRPDVARAMAQLDARRAAWEAREHEEYLRAYVQKGIDLRRPDPWACMMRLLRMKRRWLEQEDGR